jgi:hypothetical protein
MSGHDRPDTSGREWTLTGLKPDDGCNASSQFYSASGRCFAGVGVVRDLCVRSVQVARPVDLLTVGVQVAVGITRMMLNAGRHVDGCE